MSRNFAQFGAAPHVALDSGEAPALELAVRELRHMHPADRGQLVPGSVGSG